MNIRLIASDIDGTLLPYGGEISQATRDAVAACRERGIVFLIASGRWYPFARPIAESLGLSGDDPILTANGCQIITMNGDTLLESVMRPEDAQTAFGIIKDAPVQIISMCRANMYYYNSCEGSPMYRARFGVYGGMRYENHGDNRALFEEKALAAPYKLETYSHDPAVLARLRAQLEAAGLSVSSSYPTNLEIMSQGMGKGEAVAGFARKMGIPREACMAFGDNTNDLQMLQAVGWPVAVGNAVDELKAAARIVAPNCEDDGVAQIIKSRILEA